MSQGWWSRAKLARKEVTMATRKRPPPTKRHRHTEGLSGILTNHTKLEPTHGRAGWAKNCELASVTASETDSCKHQTACKGHQVPLLAHGPPQALGACKPAANVTRVSTRLREGVTRCPCEELGRPRSFGRPRTATTVCRRHVMS